MPVQGNSFLNAFKVLAKKPMVFLLLFPFHAFTPLLLLLLPLLKDLRDEKAGMLFTLVILGIILFSYLYMLVRSIFLISPAMELLKDGAAGQRTPAGWFARGFKKHWWKRAALGCAEYSISYFMSFVMQFIIMIPVFLIMFFTMGAMASNSFSTMFTMIFIIYGIIFLVYFVCGLVMYCVQSLSAFLLAAFADRGFIASFKAVFSKAGMRKYYKLLGGRFLIVLLSSILIACLAFGGVFVSAILQMDLSPDNLSEFFDDATRYEDDSYSYTSPVYEMSGDHLFDRFDMMDMLPAALIATVCWLLYSLVEIYRFAYEFCVFQEYKNEELPAAIST